jgi:hypothetical protein
VQGVTAGDGSFSFELPAGEIGLQVKPDVAWRLVARWMLLGEHADSFTRDVQLEAGNVVSGTVRTADGRVPGRSCEISVVPITGGVPEGEQLLVAVDGITGAFRGVVPIDVVWLEVANARPLYSDFVGVDARSGDVDSVVVTLSSKRVSRIPFEPPVAALIELGAIDGLGEATVTGAAGAAMPLSRVLLVNLSSGHQASAVVNGDGSFSTSIFAPPGSSVLVKHAPPGWRWAELAYGITLWVNPFPGTIVQRGFDATEASFQDVGSAAVDFPDDVVVSDNSVGTSWWFSGEMEGEQNGRHEAGESLRWTGQLHLFSPAFGPDTQPGEITVGGRGYLALLADGDRRVREATSLHMSTDLTPTGFPIQSARPLRIDLDAELTVGELEAAGDHELVATVEIEAQLPGDLPPGA